MITIQEIPEKLVNLSIKEVNELAMLLKHNINMNTVQINYKNLKYDKTSPKEYGMRLKHKN